MRHLTKEELEEWGLVEGDVYSEDVAEGLLENDEVTAEEAAFIKGYARDSEFEDSEEE